MGSTRADIYVVPRGQRLDPSHWRGSVLEEGHPDGVGIRTEAIGREGFEACLDELAAVGRWHDREQGWPHPWPDSRSTDFSYVLVVGQHEAGADDDLEAFRFGSRIRLPGDPELVFPDCGPLRPAPAPAAKRPRFPGRVAKAPIVGKVVAFLDDLGVPRTDAIDQRLKGLEDKLAAEDAAEGGAPPAASAE